jgi:hypothetical protein
MTILKDISAGKFACIFFFSFEFHNNISATSYKYTSENGSIKVMLQKCSIIGLHTNLYGTLRIYIPYNVNILLVTAQVSSAGPVNRRDTRINEREPDHHKTHKATGNTKFSLHYPPCTYILDLKLND